MNADALLCCAVPCYAKPTLNRTAEVEGTKDTGHKARRWLLVAG